MKIYQIHKSGGEWEDYYDIIVASYVNEDKAEARLKELKEEQLKHEEQSKKCSECPVVNQSCSICEHLQICCVNFDKCDVEYCNERALRLVEEYCDNYSNIEDEYLSCENECWYTDNCSYRIEVVEVIE